MEENFLQVSGNGWKVKKMGRKEEGNVERKAGCVLLTSPHFIVVA